MPKHRSKVWDHFQKDDKHSKAYCRYCTSALVINNPSNLNKHLRCKHPLVYAAQKAKIDPDDPALTAIAESQMMEAQSHKSHSDGHKSGISGGPNQDTIIKAIIKFIAKDNIPVRMVSGEGFVEMIRDLAPSFLPVATKLIKAKLDHIYEVVFLRKKAEIHKVDSISLTTSIWQNSLISTSFMDVKAHFIATDGKVKSTLLASRIFQEEHTAPALKSTFEEILTEWGIPLSKIACFVSDGTPNLSECGELLVPRKNFVCFAHLLGVTVLSAIECVPESQVCLGKVRAFVDIVHSIPSEQLEKILDRKGERPIKLVQYVETRFTSLFKMIESFLANYDNVFLIATQLGYSLEIAEQEKEFLEDCLRILKPFQLVAEELCNDKHLSLSKVIPISLCLKQTVEDVIPNTEAGHSLKQACQDMINDKIGQPEFTEVAAVSTILDPRFKNVDFQEEEARNNATGIINEYLVGCSNSINDKTDTSDSDLLWSHHDALASNRVIDPSCVVSLHTSLKTYLEAPLSHRFAEPISVWQEIGFDKNLKNYALRHLCIPATSDPPKLLFTKEGNTVYFKRSQMKSSQVHKLLFLNSLSLDEFKNI